MRAFRLVLFILLPAFFIAMPTAVIESGPSLCLIKNLFGIECPGCGLTRAFSALAHGDILAAMQFNSSIIVTGPLLCYIILRELLVNLCAVLCSCHGRKYNAVKQRG
ncbi:MAG: DUF2752 domain-containing protein [Geobacteraceae bacterium]|nr:DUF2752 domain-containing protein [Geobacteraceae bacterium]